MKNKISIFLLLLGIISCRNQTAEDQSVRHPVSVKSHVLLTDNDGEEEDEIVHPIYHNSFILKLNHKNIYIDPIGNASRYEQLPKADMILVSQYHPDYIVPSAVEVLMEKETPLLVPQKVKEILPGSLKKNALVLQDDRDTVVGDFHIRLLSFDKANGGLKIQTDQQEVLVLGKKLPKHMETNVNPDVILFQMDLTDEQLDALIQMIINLKPQKVYPYAYQSEFAYSQVAVLRERLKEQHPQIKVNILNWYPVEDKNR